MKKIQTKAQQGFTIIEVLIVLAIAGLILLIVFLAVPALQRNSRNTAIRNDAAVVLGGVNEFVANNNGQLPTGVATAADGTVTLSGAAGTSNVTTKVKAGTVATNGTAMPGSTGNITVYFNRKCNGNAFDTVVTNRAVAAGFLVEGGSSTPAQCVES
jgi:prepilin-type N-terminal cleavage/methylation domain-containing protein